MRADGLWAIALERANGMPVALNQGAMADGVGWGHDRGRMTKSWPVVAVVDDEAPMRTALGRLLKSHGFRVESFGRGDEFLAASALRTTDCVLLDLHMGGVTGFDVLASLAEQPTAPPVIVITGHDEPDTAERVRELGASAYLLKPVDEEALFGALHKAIEWNQAGDGRPKA